MAKSVEKSDNDDPVDYGVVPEAIPFVKEILAHPDDMDTRLVFADWLEERGDPRAEFIRVQVELSELTEADRDYGALYRLEQRLLKKHKSQWLGSVAKWTSHARLYRGFPEYVAMGPLKFVEHRQKLLRLAPIRNLHLITLRPEYLTQITACEELDYFLGLSFSSGGLGNEDLRILLGCSHLKDLRSLGITSLNWNGNDGAVTSVGLAEVLRQSPFVSELETLELEWDRMNSHHAEIIASMTYLDRLKHLSLDRNSIGSDGLTYLSSCAPELTTLKLRHNNIGDPGLRSLAESKHLRQLAHLDLGENSISNSGVIGMLIGNFRLRILKLDHCRLRNPAVERIAENPSASHLNVLNLEANNLTTRAAQSILDSPYLENLVALNMKENNIKTDVQKALRERYGTGVCQFSQA